MINFLSALMLSCFIAIGSTSIEPAVPAANYYQPMYEKQAAENSQHTEILRQLGYYKNITGDPYLDDRLAVIRFQSDSNLIADGIPGAQFSAALEKRKSSGKKIYSDYVTQPASNGYWITINQSKRILTLYKGKHVVAKYPIAVGRKGFETPQGKFKIINKVVNPAWSGGGHAQPVIGGAKENPLGYRWLGLSIGSQMKYGIHGNNNAYSIGRHVSRGCIRMLNEDVAELYQIVPQNTKVWIGTDDRLKKWGVYQNTNN